MRHLNTASKELIPPLGSIILYALPMTGHFDSPQPKRLASISRGLRSAERDDTPGSSPEHARPRRGRSASRLPSPAGIPLGCSRFLRLVRGCRCAQPPANRCQPFRLKARLCGSAEWHSAVSPTGSRPNDLPPTKLLPDGGPMRVANPRYGRLPACATGLPHLRPSALSAVPFPFLP